MVPQNNSLQEGSAGYIRCIHILGRAKIYVAQHERFSEALMRIPPRARGRANATKNGMELRWFNGVESTT